MMDNNDKARLLRRAIILCWVLLGICLVVKIFGGNYFDIVCENENFIAFCNFVDNSFLRYLLYYASFMFIGAMLITICKPTIIFRGKTLIKYSIISTLIWIFKIISEHLGLDDFFIYNLIILASSYLLVFAVTKRPLGSLLVMLYDFVLALVSAFVKSISIDGTLTNSFLLTSIFMLDYYILLYLSSLYRKQIKGVT